MKRKLILHRSIYGWFAKVKLLKETEMARYGNKGKGGQGKCGKGRKRNGLGCKVNRKAKR